MVLLFANKKLLIAEDLSVVVKLLFTEYLPTKELLFNKELFNEKGLLV